MTRTMIAVVTPFVTSATRTASAPATVAPTIGMNPPKNVMTHSGRASGTPHAMRPMPMQTESMAETIAWVRMNPDRVCHARVNTSVT